jgi:type IV secretory pathway TraG/TraD family ATPase VirD4
MCDEYQEIVSGNKDGLSDLNFWDKSRSSNTIGIISTQSISSFYAAIGDRDMANAILQNFRQKICFRTEDQATLDLLHKLTGYVEVANYAVSKQRGNSGKGILISHSNQSKTKTINYVNRPVIDSQLVRNLQSNQAIALLSFNGQSCDDVMNMQPIFL